MKKDADVVSNSSQYNVPQRRQLLIILVNLYKTTGIGT